MRIWWSHGEVGPNIHNISLCLEADPWGSEVSLRGLAVIHTDTAVTPKGLVVIHTDMAAIHKDLAVILRDLAVTLEVLVVIHMDLLAPTPADLEVTLADL